MQELISNRMQSGEQDLFDPIKKPGLQSFISLNKPVKTKKKQAVEMMNINRQIFSKLTVISQSRELDVWNLFQHELAPVPLTLFNLDGSMKKTQKSKSFTWLENGHATVDLPISTALTLGVVDLMILLWMVCTDSASCKTFRELSDQVLNVILGMRCKYVAVVGNNYCNQESIKSGERAHRSNVQMEEI